MPRSKKTTSKTDEEWECVVLPDDEPVVLSTTPDSPDPSDPSDPSDSSDSPAQTTSETNEWMSDQEYVERNGENCPRCRGTNIEGTGNRDFDSDYASNEIQCLDCEALWDDIFSLSGYTRTTSQ